VKKSWLVCILSLLLCISCLSCSPLRTGAFAYVNSSHNREETVSKVKKIYIDNAFGEADLLSIQDAIDQWTYALNGYMVFDIRSFDPVGGSLVPREEAARGDAWLFMKIDSSNYILAQHDNRPAGMVALAFCDYVGGNLMYVVRDRIDNDQVRGIVMHEMGHLLGAKHVNEDADLMAPSYDNINAQCIDRTTLMQIAKTQGFPFQNMNYCIYSDDTMKKSGAKEASAKHFVD